MPKSEIHTKIGGQTVKLTNLQKLLYKESKISKAEVIQYYLSVQSHMLDFCSKRPLTLIRYPDGIDATHFYSKNAPAHTPDWISTYDLPWDADNTYASLQKEADLAYFANLAALEMHITSGRYPSIECPDHFIIDLDPDEGITFAQLKETALSIRQYLEERRYFVYIKTSGGKGLHLMVPLIADSTYAEVMGHFKALFGAYTKAHPDTTLRISKERRKGKILIDIYRNHQGNTTVAPLSLRAKTNAPVSMPFPWEYLEKLEGSQYFTLRNISEYEDWMSLWSDYENRAVSIKENTDEIDASLTSYHEKRNFKITNEPLPLKSPTVNGKFVVQLHNATNLHYDLRLGMDGVLKSWAIPKALPQSKEEQRLAIQTEDHPAQYLTFEGVIPKGEYGAGQMWVMDTGTYDLNEAKKGKYTFKLNGKYLKASYHIFQTKDAQWLIKSAENTTILIPEYKPMLASATDKLESAKKVFYEVKWDGIRVLIKKENTAVTIFSRSGRDITKLFPELTSPDSYQATSCVIDGEIVVLDDGGRPVFADVISRMHGKNTSHRKNAVLYSFDLLYLDGIELTSLPIERRRAILNVILDKGEHIRFSDTFTDGQQLFEAIKAQKMEGVMVKVLGSKYQSGARTHDWTKYKVRTEEEVAYIIGYTEGSGDRSPYFGSLVLAHLIEDKWVYKGRVGTGFNGKLLQEITEILKQLPIVKKCISEKIDEENKTTWIEPTLRCEINYASLTPSDTYREPVFVTLL